MPKYSTDFRPLPYLISCLKGIQLDRETFTQRIGFDHWPIPVKELPGDWGQELEGISITIIVPFESGDEICRNAKFISDLGPMLGRSGSCALSVQRQTIEIGASWQGSKHRVSFKSKTEVERPASLPIVTELETHFKDRFKSPKYPPKLSGSDWLVYECRETILPEDIEKLATLCGHEKLGYTSFRYGSVEADPTLVKEALRAISASPFRTRKGIFRVTFIITSLDLDKPSALEDIAKASPITMAVYVGRVPQAKSKTPTTVYIITDPNGFKVEVVCKKSLPKTIDRLFNDIGLRLSRCDD